jgi:CHAD domain-containing protein
LAGLIGRSSMHPELQSKPWYSAKPGSPTVIRLESRSRETAMPPSPKTKRKVAVRVEPAQRSRRHAIPRLHPLMACDTAFRIVARRYLGDLTANHKATCGGDPVALHQMRIALTRLRTAFLFFSPMIVDTEQTRIKSELKWLNSHLGVVRDLDVAIERLHAVDKRQPQAIPDHRSLTMKRSDGHRRLAQALRLARYRHLIKITSNWIENGPWSISKGKRTAKQRACSIAAYGADKLARWQQKLLKKSRKLPKMDPKKRHRLRLLNKKLCYSIEFFEDLSSDKRISRQRAALKYLRKAQKSLGQLNDDANSRSLAAALQREGVQAPLQFLGPKREKQLIRTAATAYRKLAAL